MCQMCSDLKGREKCPECGREICFDLAPAETGATRAYATLSGDLYCWNCGPKHDTPESAEEFAAYYPREDDEL